MCNYVYFLIYATEDIHNTMFLYITEYSVLAYKHNIIHIILIYTLCIIINIYEKSM